MDILPRTNPTQVGKYDSVHENNEETVFLVPIYIVRINLMQRKYEKLKHREENSYVE